MKLFATLFLGSTLAQDNYYDYENNNYVYNNDYYDYENVSYNLDGYEAASFGNETDYLEGAAPAEEDNRAHHEIFQLAGGNNNHNHQQQNNNMNQNRPNNNKPPKQQNKPKPPKPQPPKQQNKPHKGDVHAHHTAEQHHAFMTAQQNAQNAQVEQMNAAQNGMKDAGNYGSPAYPASGHQCWKCHADSWELCEMGGTLQTCLPNENSCELEIRERGGKIIQILTGCKATDACKNNMANNFMEDNPDITQCRPEGPAKGYHHSVCRQCCDTPNCVKDPDWWYPQTRAEWAYTGEETPAYPADPYPAAGGY